MRLLKNNVVAFILLILISAISFKFTDIIYMIISYNTQEWIKILVYCITQLCIILSYYFCGKLFLKCCNTRECFMSCLSVFITLLICYVLAMYIPFFENSDIIIITSSTYPVHYMTAEITKNISFLTQSVFDGLFVIGIPYFSLVFGAKTKGTRDKTRDRGTVLLS